jgi:outer membrane protein assembly factor BamB
MFSIKNFLIISWCLCIFVGGFWFAIIVVPIMKPAHGLFSKVTVLDRSKVEDGFLLFSPFIAKTNSTTEGEVYLTTLTGRIMHTWKTKYSTLYSLATPDGHLYTAQITPSDLMKAPGGGKTGLLQELDWNGHVVWEFKDEMLHHDFDVDLSTHTVYALTFTKVPDSFSRHIKGGKNTSMKDFWSDTIIAIDATGNIVWKYALADHMQSEDFILDPITPRNEWSHSNSVKFYTTNPINGKPAILLSSRHLNTVFLIDRETGNILWKSPKGIFNYQHDATLTPSGTVLAFDNGVSRQQERPFLWSRLVEVDVHTNKVVWKFQGGETGPEMGSFAASIMSGTQRLPNGNTLGIDSLKGHIFEVTKEGKVVFSFINPYQALDTTSPFGNNVIFKARKLPLTFFENGVL